MDRETLSLPVANSQFYTATFPSIANILGPVAVDRESKENLNNSTTSISTLTSSVASINLSAPIVELTEEVNGRFRYW